MTEDRSLRLQFTDPQRVANALSTLQGLLIGMAADGVIQASELRVLKQWLSETRDVAGHHPFNEIVPILHTALLDGRLSSEEVADLVWLCDQLIDDAGGIDRATCDMQQLHGVLAGIASNGRVTVEEARGLEDWLAKHQHLRTVWPYDEVEAMLTAAMADGQISSAEQITLLAFFEQFGAIGPHRMVVPQAALPESLEGVCASCPEVEFDERSFCFTGDSRRCTREQFEAIVQCCGGTVRKQVVKDLDYLVIGCAGNPCWAYACYGRKVEQAVKLRQSGGAVQLIHENDFWDAVMDAGVEPPPLGPGS